MTLVRAVVEKSLKNVVARNNEIDSRVYET